MNFFVFVFVFITYVILNRQVPEYSKSRWLEWKFHTPHLTESWEISSFFIQKFWNVSPTSFPKTLANLPWLCHKLIGIFSYYIRIFHTFLAYHASWAGPRRLFRVSFSCLVKILVRNKVLKWSVNLLFSNSLLYYSIFFPSHSPHSICYTLTFIQLISINFK